MTAEELVLLWERVGNGIGGRLNTGKCFKGRTIHKDNPIPLNLVRRAILAIKAHPGKNWEALFTRVKGTKKLNGSIVRQKYHDMRSAKKANSEDGCYETYFKADLLWVLDHKNMMDIESGIYD